MADIFADERPDPLPPFHDENLGNPPFASPGDAFEYFFDDEVLVFYVNVQMRKQNIIFKRIQKKRKSTWLEMEICFSDRHENFHELFDVCVCVFVRVSLNYFFINLEYIIKICLLHWNSL